jgi:hypothetical protein
LTLNFLNQNFTFSIKRHKDIQTFLCIAFGIKLLSLLDLINGCLRTVKEVKIHEGKTANNCSIRGVLNVLVKLEPEWQIQWIMSCLHHTWHHHGLILHGLIHLRHSWVSYPHNLLRYILHHHLRSRLHPHIILWLCLAKPRRHHHLRVLRSSPNSRVTHSSGSCYHLLLLHQVYWHGISTILNLNHLIRIRHGWRWHHWWCLMRHRSLLLSNSLLSKFSIAMSKRATIFVWAIFS